MKHSVGVLPFIRWSPFFYAQTEQNNYGDHTMQPSRFTVRTDHETCALLMEIKRLMRTIRPASMPTTADAIRFAIRQTAKLASEANRA